MYSDTDRRGFVSLFEMDRPEAVAVLSALEEADKIWKEGLKKYKKYGNWQLDTAALQRKLWYSQNLAISGKIQVALKAAIRNIEIEK